MLFAKGSENNAFSLLVVVGTSAGEESLVGGPLAGAIGVETSLSLFRVEVVVVVITGVVKAIVVVVVFVNKF